MLRQESKIKGSKVPKPKPSIAFGSHNFSQENQDIFSSLPPLHQNVARDSLKHRLNYNISPDAGHGFLALAINSSLGSIP